MAEPPVSSSEEPDASLSGASGQQAEQPDAGASSRPFDPASTRHELGSPQLNQPALSSDALPSTDPNHATASNASVPPPLVVDPQHDPSDSDSALGSVDDDEIARFTASLTSSLERYPIEHGRRYHAYRDGVYSLPNDEPELDRLDMSHCMVTTAIGKRLFLAPIPDQVHRILDIGTGTGIWSIEVALAPGKWAIAVDGASLRVANETKGDIYPNAMVIGNDLGPVQPSWIPPNVKFEVDDVESPWIHPDPFDFIFSRYMAVSIGNWRTLIRRIYENLTNGGWAEFHDFDFTFYAEDGTLDDDLPMMNWNRTILDTFRKVGREPCPGKFIADWVKEAGFQSIHHEIIKMPIGAWAKEKTMKTVGMLNLITLLEGVEGFSLRVFSNFLDWKHEEIQVLLAQVRSDLKRRDLHGQFDLHVIYAQKPKILY